MNAFQKLGLGEKLARALEENRYSAPSPIQAEAIPHLLAGRDLWGCAQTGTGKTAAFALPILQAISDRPARREPKRPRALVLVPTRELASQVARSFETYGRHARASYAVVFGGVSAGRQIKALLGGVDVLVATPGRLLDLVQQKAADLSVVEFFVLDEADRMLDMGFAPDVKRIIARLPERRQSLLFSATMPPEILALAEQILKDPARVEVAPAATTAERVTQKVCHVGHSGKHGLLVHLLGETPSGLALVFTRTKHGANAVAKRLLGSGHAAGVIHGNKSQNAREKALEEFRTGRARVLVATDIAARGIDVKGISLVVNYDVPVEPEAYVHRIGRTARAGASGLALTLCSPAERPLLREIERLIRHRIPEHDHPFGCPREEEGPAQKKNPRTPGAVPGHPKSRQQHNPRRNRFRRPPR